MHVSTCASVHSSHAVRIFMELSVVNLCFRWDMISAEKAPPCLWDSWIHSFSQNTKSDHPQIKSTDLAIACRFPWSDVALRTAGCPNKLAMSTFLQKNPINRILNEGRFLNTSDKVQYRIKRAWIKRDPPVQLCSRSLELYFTGYRSSFFHLLEPCHRFAVVSLSFFFISGFLISCQLCGKVRVLEETANSTWTRLLRVFWRQKNW